ncbi:tRNA 5-methylaminomethyl-2-thiouridine synthase subunit TusD [hydrothermal vent metagenome]|uniref:tRNA 5-methylaminomethyl-2-thiouridine synthase subunit TusD n=1 Tax=hydrothermal vent metagenome TaxID=652676 RepID=A0A3B0YT83_9ZZZZ
MKLTILLLEGPYNHEASDSAWNLIQAARKAGHEIRGVFLYNDGVFALKDKQDTKALGIKGFMASMGALVDFEVEKVYVDQQSLQERNLSEDTEEPVKPKVLDSAAIRALMVDQDSIVSL